jgi:hypothetical protein
MRCGWVVKLTGRPAMSLTIMPSTLAAEMIKTKSNPKTDLNFMVFFCSAVF